MKSFSYDMVQTTPSSSVAFDILLNFCTSEGLEEEYVIGIAIVLMSTTRNAPLPTLAPPRAISGPSVASKKHWISDRLFQYLDKCMSVSSTVDALDSLLCGVFFDPSVPCNLVGAMSLGIRNALRPVGNDYQKFLTAVALRRPGLSFFWAAAVSTGQSQPFLGLALSDVPPACLTAALWTNTTQSFLQVSYKSSTATKESPVPRSCEFRTSFFCRPEVSQPWTAAPPFGSTISSNLSLDVRQHYNHNHRPLRWRLFWTLRSGEKVPASPQNRVKSPTPVCSLQYEKNAVDPQSEQQK